MCFAQGHNAVRLEPAVPRSRVQHSTTEPVAPRGYRLLDAECSGSVGRALDWGSREQTVTWLRLTAG